MNLNLPQMITLVASIATLILLVPSIYFLWLADHHLDRARQMSAGRPDPGPDPEPVKFVKDQMSALKASERRWMGDDA
jgi:hypothetical protein